ncbi:MAG: hypothetical protein IJ391_04975, partial [Clostridia bacterium]|nr:hypothetical protein [Clostridia bacterium]
MLSINRKAVISFVTILYFYRRTNSMTNTKRALFLSIVSMFLCIVMLASTTFAWFTDSVESTNNIIK